jgi:Holliday junction resolvase RusA-like endonuclease
MFREALSLESNAPVATGNPVENALAFESASLEIAEAAHEMEMMDYQQEELEHAHASLESIAVSLEGLVANDERGLDRVAAEGYRHAISAIVGDALPNPVSSLESFGGESECAEATQISLEGIKDTVKKIWEAIKRAVSNAIKATSDFLAKLFGGVAKMEKRVEDLKKQLKEAQDNKHTVKEGEFKLPGAGRLELDGSINERALEQGMSMVNDITLTTIDETQKAAESIYKEISDFYKKGGKPDDLDDVSKLAGGAISKIKTKAVGSLLPGGKTFVTEGTKEDGAPGKATIKVSDHPSAKNFDGSTKVDVPSLATIGKMLDSAEKAAKHLSKAKKDRDNLKKVRENVMDEAEKWSKDAEKGKLSEMWTEGKVSVALRMAQSSLFSNIGQMDGYVFSYNRALVAAADAALKQYEAPKKD